MMVLDLQKIDGIESVLMKERIIDLIKVSDSNSDHYDPMSVDYGDDGFFEGVDLSGSHWE